jgi:hypothetical protein
MADRDRDPPARASQISGSSRVPVDVVTEPDRELEQRLAAARPRPRSGFVSELDTALFPRPERRRSRRLALQPLFAAAAVTTALAAVALVLSLTGLSPLQAGGNDPVSAEGCVTVSVPKWVMRPTIVIGKDGKLRTEDRRTRIYRQVRRCP